MGIFLIFLLLPFPVISDEWMAAALLVSESKVLVFQWCRLQQSFSNAEQVGASQTWCHLVSSNFPHHTESLLALQGGEERMLVPAANYGCNVHSRKHDWQTGMMDCTWSLWDFMWYSCAIRNPEMGYLRVNCCCYCHWLPKVAAAMLVWTLPSSPSSAVLFICLVSVSELWMCPGPGSMGVRLPGCCDSMIMSLCHCGKWHQFCSFCHSMSGTKLHEDHSMTDIVRHI